MRSGGNSSLCFLVVLAASGCGLAAGRGGDDVHTEFTSLFQSDSTKSPSAEELTIPENAQAHYAYLRGELALSDENYDEALTLFETAAKYESGPAPALRRRLAQLYIKAGRLNDAEKQIRLGLEGAPNDIQLLQLLGGVAATLKDTPRAVETYRQIIKLQAPENEEAYIMLASLYVQEGKFDEARGVLNELLTAQPKSVFGYYYLGRIAEVKNELDVAVQQYRKALEINPEADVIELDLARVLIRQDKNADAQALLSEVLRGNPQNAGARRLLGQLYLQENKLTEAREQFEALGELESDPADTRFKVALIKIQQGQLEGAEADLNLILASDPANMLARYYLASVYAGLQRPNDALAQAARIPEGDKLYGEAQVFTAYVLQREKRIPEATAVVEKALKSQPDDRKLLAFLAGLKKESGDLPGAIATMKRLSELEPGNDHFLFTLGAYYDELGDKQQAVELMRKAVEINPKNANALNYLAYTLAELNTNLPEALDFIKRAIEVEKDNGFYLDTLGWIYYRLGRYPDALREIERGLKLVPDDAVLLEHLGAVQLKLGKKREAAVTLKKSLQNATRSDDKQVDERVRALLQEINEPLP